MTQRKQGQFKNDNLQSSGGYSKRNKPEHIEMKVKYSRFRHNAKQTRFTLPTGPRRQGDPFFSKSKKKKSRFTSQRSKYVNLQAHDLVFLTTISMM